MTKQVKIFRWQTVLLVLVALFFFESLLVDSCFAQRRGRGSRGGSQRAVITTDSVPDFSDLTNEKPLGAKPFLDRAIVAPVVSAKIARHAERILEKYDLDGSGALEPEEWQNMEGAPQSIDLDGNFILTPGEITAHIAHFAQGRTIHYPYPVRRFVSTSEPEQTSSLFKPLSDPPPKPVRQASSADGVSPDDDISLEEIEESTMPDDESEEDIAEETLELPGTIPAPRGKKYYTPTHQLPKWFVQRDLNGDGQLSLVEFTPSLSNQGIANFGKLDKNGDGFITPDERPRQQQ